MGFGKSFLLSLVAFVGLNFIFVILYFAIDQDSGGFDSLMTTIEDAPLMIIFYLFGSVASTPFINLDGAIAQPLFNGDTAFLILSLGYLAAPIIAAILAGKFAESKFQGFTGWMLTVIVSTVTVVVGVFLSQTMLNTLKSSTYFVYFNTYFPSLLLSGGFEEVLIYLIISCVVNIGFYSFFAFLLSKTEYY
ncbi:MAG: hypothetical protein ACFE94_01860 [Candidatus Hodarchaeota archaeon]